VSGAGRRVFQPGEVLTATNVQNYLQDQAVQYYAGTAARGSAIGTATTEGMVSYLADTDQLQVAIGTATWQDVSLAQSDNFLINGGFDIWQRGTGANAGSNSGVYTTTDRWLCTNTTTTYQRATTTPDASFRYSLRGNCTASQFAANQMIETANANYMAGKTVTFSVYAYATSSETFSARIYTSTVADDSIGGSWAANPATTTVTLAAATWQRITVTTTILSNVQSIRVQMYSPTGVTNTFYVAGAQLEIGGVATNFKRNQPNQQAELAACQRYYLRYSYVTGASTIIGHTTGTSTTAAATQVYFPVNMRTTPSTTIEWSGTGSHYSAAGLNGSGATISNTTGIAINSSYVSPQSALLSLTGTGYTSGNQYALAIVNTNGYIAFSAEL